MRRLTLATAAVLALVASACLTERNLDKPLPGATPPEPPHLAIRRTKGENKTLVHESTVLVQKGHDEVRHGKDQTWYPSGAKEWEREFDHGHPKGTWRKWYENGQLASETEFAGTDVERPMRFWHANGQLAAEGPAKNGSRTGAWKFWRADGSLSEEGSYVGSLREGDWNIWSDGNPEPQVAHYVGGVIRTQR